MGQVRTDNEFTVMSYNCENLFDLNDDEGKDDEEYLEGGARGWNAGRMYAKMKNIGKVIMAANTMRPVDIVCLQEVENDSVITYLTQRTPLSAIGYKYLMTNSSDARGIDVALLYSPFTFAPLNHHSIRPYTTTPTRDILYVSGVHTCSEVPVVRDTLDIYVVHLPSKLNGKESEANRDIVAKEIELSIDSLLRIRQNAKIVVLGDFNDGPESKLSRNHFKRMINLAKSYGNKKQGTYKYKGTWETIDQVLVSPSLMKNDGLTPSLGLHVDSALILNQPFLMESDETEGGMKPKRTYVGYRYNGGFSDHLPVVVKMK